MKQHVQITPSAEAYSLDTLIYRQLFQQLHVQVSAILWEGIATKILSLERYFRE